MFDPELQGHLPVRQRLFERVQTERLSGSLVLVGPNAIGKRRVAMELAQRELCFRRTACGECAGCKPFRAETIPLELPNMLRIAPEGKAGLIKIGTIREDDLVEGGVIRWAHQASLPGTHRWILVEDAHRLNGSSANMLLKILEEPPSSTHFLLVTHRPEVMIQTIRSRCERISMRALEDDEVWTIAQRAGWKFGDREAWVALAWGTLRYLDPAAFALAVAQMEAWLAIASGESWTTKKVYSCCGVEKETDQHGIKTFYAYDGLQRQTKTSLMICSRFGEALSGLLMVQGDWTRNAA